MSAQPTQKQPTHARFGSRTSSRSMLASEVDMINRYARKYSTQYKAAPYQAVSPAFSSTKAPDDSSSTASSKMSSVSKQHTTAMSQRHAKRPSNLIHPQNHNLWNDNAMSNQHRDMESAMESMIVTYQTRLEKQAHFLDEIEREAAQNKNFGKLENADDWSNLEVCHWLTTIHLEKYIQSFADQIIDGSILIRDLDESILIQELGVKRIHVKKIMREIAKLRELSPKLSKKGGDSKDALVQSLNLEIQSLQRENKHLREQIKSLQSQVSNSQDTGSHFSSNGSSMSSLQNSYNNNNNNSNSSHNNGNSSGSKYSGYGGYGASHNYTVNPRNYKKY